MQSLVLFDIDATLLKTDGAGMAAMGDAGRELFGSAFTIDGIDFAGRLDPLIFRELFAMNNVPRTADAEQRFRQTYRGHLTRRLASTATARALPGALDLVNAVRNQNSHAIGVLTGNFQETGSLKLSACGLNPSWFPICAWGDDSPHDPPARDHLPPVAIQRFRDHFGRDIDPARVTIIGDTPHDARCAQVNGCRCIAVATGKFSVEDLRQTTADHIVSDLTQTTALLKMLA